MSESSTRRSEAWTNGSTRRLDASSRNRWCDSSITTKSYFISLPAPTSRHDRSRPCAVADLDSLRSSDSGWRSRDGAVGFD